MRIDWNKHTLLPTIAQEAKSGDILMMAYMNKEAYELTLKTGFAHYFSRSKQRIWRKGEESGHTQEIVDVLIDCDSDTILLKVNQKGVACHTGRKSCFFTSVKDEKEVLKQEVNIEDKYSIVDVLYHIILERKNDSSKKSWTKKLLNDKKLLLSKIQEEADELCIAIDKEDESQVIYEAADLLYHSLVGLGLREVSPDRVKQELKRRFGISGIEEKESRVRGIKK